MIVKKVYQTLENRVKNYDELTKMDLLTQLEENGPYPCQWENTWLGDGFYFWDTFIDNAHWWGESRNYPKGYIICEAVCDYDYSSNACLDLVGNTEHIEAFRKAFNWLKKKGLANEHTTVKRIIHFLKDTSETFPIDAVRVDGRKSKSYNSPYNFTLKFEENGNLPAYFDGSPTIQICFFKKNSLNLRDFKIIYPDEYR